MLRAINSLLVAGVLVAAFVLYAQAHRIRGDARAIAKVRKAITEEIESARLLRAEWSYLTRPARLEQLARVNLQLRPAGADQFISPAMLDRLIGPRPAPNPASSPVDPIGAMLRENR